MFKTEESMKVRFLGTMKGWLNSKCKTPVCENDLSLISGSGLLWSWIISFTGVFLEIKFVSDVLLEVKLLELNASVTATLTFKVN